MAENRSSRSPEQVMALWALVPGAIATLLAFGIGAFVRPGVGASAAIGAAVAVVGFCGQVLALGWARTVSLAANQAVALFGFLVLLGAIGGLYAALRTTGPWFSKQAFGGGLLALIPVAAFEARIARRGRLAEAILDADRATTAARTKADRR
jgi:hypothetical protein